jgi:hypothetical protein
MDYPSGWPAIPAANVRRTRALSGGATPLVSVGDRVRPDQPLAERTGPHGEREMVLAGLAGRVAHLTPGQSLSIEGVATVIHGIVGVGGTAVGPLHFLPRAESVAVVPLPPGTVLVFPGQAPLTLLQRAAASGVAAIIAASIGVRELEAFTRADMTAALDGLIPEMAQLSLPLVFTEGIGSFAMDSVTFQLLSQRVGDVALVSGATDPRRNLRPEVLLPLPLGSPPMPTPADDAIREGSHIRLIAGSARGRRGEVVHLFEQRQVVPPGLVVLAARVRLENGTSPVVPVAFLERVG